MDSNTLLDYALFQLTPTRTRCDLVVCCGKTSEKLASGLVEPFISHLKFAKDQIPKGGYSITMRPPSSKTSWFTKATFQRFVRFVSTPEILERSVRIEREILQIESSVQSNGTPNTGLPMDEENLSMAHGITRKSSSSTKTKGDGETINGNIVEENSKHRLQRLLDTRKAILRKEQAMAYARAIVAGFEIDLIDDLICFADAFGAARLREACIDFKELYKQKHTDGQWMNELAAMEACLPPEFSYTNSGVILACENNGIGTASLVRNGSQDVSSELATDPTNNDDRGSDQVSSAKGQMPMPWPNQIPQYMYNFQGPIQQYPPYQGHPFPTMLPIPAYPQEHMHWRETGNGGHVKESKTNRRRRSSRKKERPSSEEDSEDSEENNQTDYSASDSGSDSDIVRKKESKSMHHNKHRNKSSKTVVIRNINYITSKRKDGDRDGFSDGSSSVEDLLIDEDYLKKEVIDAVASLDKQPNAKPHKSRNRGRHDSTNMKNGLNGSADKNMNHYEAASMSEDGTKNDNWGAFQNLLMSNEESTVDEVMTKHPVDFQDEHFVIKNPEIGASFTNSDALEMESKITVRRSVTDDSVLLTEKIGENQSKVDMVNFADDEIMRPSMKKGYDADTQFVISQRLEEPGFDAPVCEFTSESSMSRKHKGEDWFVVSKLGDLDIHGARGTIFDENTSLPFQEPKKGTAAIDDSILVQSRPVVDDLYDSQWRTDISMVEDLSVAKIENGPSNNPQAELRHSGTCEPDDLCMVLVRDSELNSARASWTPGMDYGIEVSFAEADQKISVIGTNAAEKKHLVNGKDINAKKAAGPPKVSRGSLAKNKLDTSIKNKKTTPSSRLMVQKSRLETEEEIRKRMEELVIQRQKRIAERTAASGQTLASPKKGPVANRTTSLKPQHRSQSAVQRRKSLP